MQTEVGLKVQEILLRGESVPEEMAAKMIEDKINSPEVIHHGGYHNKGSCPSGIWR